MSLRQLSIHPSLKGKLPDIIDITDDLPRIKRWEELSKPYRHKGKWDGKTYHTGFRKTEDIDTIVVHHSGPPEGTLESHARTHSRKWGAGIAYHVGIDQGKIKQLNDLLTFSYHVGNHNTYTVGIVVNADLSKREMTSLERELLYGAIMSVKAVLPIKYILAHNELGATACPCTSINLIRSDIASLEEQLAYNESPSNLDTEVYATIKRANDLYAKYLNKDGKHTRDQPEAKRKLTILHAELKKRGWMA